MIKLTRSQSLNSIIHRLIVLPVFVLVGLISLGSSCGDKPTQSDPLPTITLVSTTNTDIMPGDIVTIVFATTDTDSVLSYPGAVEVVLDGTDIAFTGFPIGGVLGLYPVTHRGIVASLTPTVVPAVSAEQINLKMLKRMKNPYLVYQLDATAYPGNSGSAMYDKKTGEVVGIINKVFVQSTKEAVISNPSGITYAIPVKYLHQVIKEHNLVI